MLTLFDFLVGGGPPGYDFRNNEKVDLTAKNHYTTVSSTTGCFSTNKQKIRADFEQLRQVTGWLIGLF